LQREVRVLALDHSGLAQAVLGVTSQDFIKFWSEFLFCFVVLIENRQGFKTFEFN
jgi:hypothetical protein